MAIFQKKPIKATKSLKSMYQQGVFLKRLGHLLLEGFSLQDALHFLKTTGDKTMRLWIESIEQGMNQGQPFYRQLKELAFPNQICSQIYFSMIHGYFAQTIYDCGEQLLAKMNRKKSLQQLLAYPMMLVIFMIGMLFAMRYILLPHIAQITTSGTSHMGLGTKLVFLLIRESPIILIVTGLIGGILIVLFRLYLSEKSAIETSTILVKMPIATDLLRLYYTQFLAMEWGQLIKGGTRLKEIIDIMKSDTNSNLVNELGVVMTDYLMRGYTFSEAISEFEFLNEELVDIIDFGEQSSDLGKELLLYSSQCEEELQLRIERLMTFIQPIVFIGIGLTIVAIYAALLLPTFSMLNGI